MDQIGLFWNVLNLIDINLNLKIYYWNLPKNLIGFKIVLPLARMHINILINFNWLFKRIIKINT